jgi:putative membrane protein
MTMSDNTARWMSTRALAIGLLLAALGAQAQTPDESKQKMPAETTDRTAMPAPDRTAMKNVTPEEFAQKAAVIGKAEIQLGQLAMQRSEDADVRRYAERMVKDHSAADAKLKQIAAKDNLQLPQALDPEHEAAKQKLSSLKGEAFDREYAKTMAKGHDKAVALFESASQSSQMPADLKQFAASTLPTLEQHKEMAHSLHGDQQ